MRGRRRLGDLIEQFHVRRALVEVVVPDQTAERLAAELAVFRLIDALEDRTLVPRRPLVPLERLAKIQLRDVQDADLQHLVGLGVVDEVVQPAPCAFELLHVLVVQDLVDLLGQLLVELRDDRFNRLDDIRADQLGVGERLLGQRAHGPFDGFLRLVGLRLELFSQKRIELGDFERPSRGRCDLLGIGVGHICAPLRSSFLGGAFRFLLGRRQRLQQGRVLQQLGDELLRPALSIHIRNEVRQLLSRLEQLVERIDFARNRGG